MEIAMTINNAFKVDFPSSSSSDTTTTTTDDDPACTWNNWESSVVDWGTLSSDRDEFQDLIESMMDDGSRLELAFVVGHETSYSAVSTDTMVADEETNGEDFKGLRLVHLLMAAADALAGATKSSELARVILVRLKELVSPNDGTNMERLAAYFTEALQGLLEVSAGGGGQGKRLITNGTRHHAVTSIIKRTCLQLFTNPKS